MSPVEIVRQVVKTLDDKKGEDIKVIRINDLSILADYFVFCTGTSSTHVKTLAEEVDFQLGQKGVNPLRSEGFGDASWIVLDYGSVLVHVFYPDTRKFYDLERLWQDGEEIAVNTLLEGK